MSRVVRAFLLTSVLAATLIGSAAARAQEADEEPIAVAAEAEPSYVAVDEPQPQPQPEVSAPLVILTAEPTLVPLVVAAPTAAPTAAPAVGNKIAATVVDNRFQPNALSVGVGSTITWTNNGNNIHTLTSPDGIFDSGALIGGQSFSFTFDKAGTFRLICRQHGLNGMAGQIVVQ